MKNECRQMTTAYHYPDPAAVRYPRCGIGASISSEPTSPVGAAVTLRQGRRLAIPPWPMVHPALKAGEQLDASVVNMRFVKPIDTES